MFTRVPWGRVIVSVAVPAALLFAVGIALNAKLEIVSTKKLALASLVIALALFPMVFGSLALLFGKGDYGFGTAVRTRRAVGALLLVGAAAGGVVLSGATLVTYSLIVPYSQTYWGPFTFSAADWAKYSDRRWYMADELIEQNRLKGMDRSQVLALLGKPDGETHELGGELRYYLGPERPIPVDSETLVVAFDSSGRVHRYWIERD